MEVHSLTWHESEDGRTMMKVPTLIHQNVPHNGGVHAVKTEAIESVDDKIFASNMKQQSSVLCYDGTVDTGMLVGKRVSIKVYSDDRLDIILDGFITDAISVTNGILLKMSEKGKEHFVFTIEVKTANIVEKDGCLICIFDEHKDDTDYRCDVRIFVA